MSAKNRNGYRVEGHSWHTIGRVEWMTFGDVDLHQRCPRCGEERQLAIRAGQGYLMGRRPAESCAAQRRRRRRGGRQRVNAAAVKAG